MQADRTAAPSDTQPGVAPVVSKTKEDYPAYKVEPVVRARPPVESTNPLVPADPVPTDYTSKAKQDYAPPNAGVDRSAAPPPSRRPKPEAAEEPAPSKVRCEHDAAPCTSSAEA